MQEKASSASFALLGRTYLQPSSHVPATVLARTCAKKTIITIFLLIPGNSHSQAGGQKKDCVTNGTQSDMYV